MGQFPFTLVSICITSNNCYILVVCGILWAVQTFLEGRQIVTTGYIQVVHLIPENPALTSLESTHFQHFFPQQRTKFFFTILYKPDARIFIQQEIPTRPTRWMFSRVSGAERPFVSRATLALWHPHWIINRTLLI